MENARLSEPLRNLLGIYEQKTIKQYLVERDIKLDILRKNVKSNKKKNKVNKNKNDDNTDNCIEYTGGDLVYELLCG